MSKESNQTTNRKVQIIRITLVIATLLLFVFFAYTFTSSYKQYQDIQQRVDHLHKSINATRHDYSEILSQYSQAENEFRLFSIDFNETHYTNYRNTLKSIELKIDSMLVKFSISEEVEKQYPEHLALHKKLTDDFLAIRLKIDDLLGYSQELNTINEGEVNRIQIPIPPSLRGTISKNTDSIASENILVINKKPFFKRIFDNKSDSIRLSEVTRIEEEKAEIIKEFSQELRTSYTTSQDRLNELKKSFSMLRAKERELLINNIQLLQEVNAIIRNIRNNHIISQRHASELEIQKLMIKANSFKWQTTLSLAFMLVMICLIVYYQFFVAYYEKKLISEKSYTAKLAQEKTDTLAEITHEIRTPINSLIGIVDILRKKQIFDPQDKLLLESAYSDLSSTSKTINNILNLSRIEEQEINVTKFSIILLVEDIIENYQNRAKLKGLTLQYKSAIDIPRHIHSDEFKLRQIITNLISNAIKYSEKGTITCTLKLKKPKTLHIRVVDEGIGMDEKTKENIFKKYYTTTEAKKRTEGIGLGLYITKKLVQNLGGKINCESRIGKGTTFYVDIPLSEEDNNQMSSEITNTEDILHSTDNIRLMIVDDNPLNLLYMKQLFGNYDKVFTAKNGAEALTVIQSNPVDIIITDINMPIMDGNELLANIRANKAFDHIKIIATSSDTEQVYIKNKNNDLRFDHILIKPFDEKEANRGIYMAKYGTEPPTR